MFLFVCIRVQYSLEDEVGVMGPMQPTLYRKYLKLIFSTALIQAVDFIKTQVQRSLENLIEASDF